METKELAKIAAKWWADQLRSKSKQNVGNATISILASVIENKARELVPINDKMLVEFQSILEDEIVKKIERERQFGNVTIGVDYHPDLILADAAKKALINEAHFPLKTVMWLGLDSIEVSCGYGGAIEVIEVRNE